MTARMVPEPAEPVADPVPLYDVRALTGGADLARLRLDDQIYTLRVTRAGKLILTK